MAERIRLFFKIEMRADEDMDDGLDLIMGRVTVWPSMGSMAQ